MSITTLSDNPKLAKALVAADSRATTAQPVVRLDISENTGDGYGNNVAGQVTTAPGAGTAYRSHKVHVYGEDIASYDIIISGPENLQPSSGASTVVSGANGASGADMSGNTWGFAWGELGEDVAEMNYNSLGEDISVIKESNPTGAMDYDKKLVFGANFSTDANPGTYTASVTLSLTAVPKVIGQYWYDKDGNPTYIDTGIDTMQDVDSEFVAKYCRLDGNANDNQWGKVPVGATLTLRDQRNGYDTGTMTGSNGKEHSLNEYVIVKLPDGNCWMQENLRLKGGTKITPQDSDVKSDWTLPESNTGSWSWNASDAQMKEGSSSSKNWEVLYGNYYSWCAITAGSCSRVTSQGALASSSVCPKNWKIPSGYNGQFSNLFKKASLGNDYASQLKAALSIPYSLVMAGLMHEGSNIQSAGSYCRYWSRTAEGSTTAYTLFFDGGTFYPGTSDSNKYFGLSARCIAEPTS